MAAAFVAMNETHAKSGAPIYDATTPRHGSLLAQARADALKDQLVIDMHTHFLREAR
jgi:hypothetical protein